MKQYVFTMITAIVLFSMVSSVAASAFVMGSHEYKLEGVISEGGSNITGTGYDSYISIGQPIISHDRNGGINMKNENYKLCLGVFCTGIFETPYQIQVEGKLFYDTGVKFANSQANIIAKYGSEVYKGPTIITDDDGNFAGNVTVPERLIEKDFLIEIYAKGRIEAVYTCQYNTMSSPPTCD